MTGTTGLRGLAATPGVATGPWASVALTPLPPPGRIEPEQIAAEFARVQAAAGSVATDLAALAERVRQSGHDAEAAIFEAQVEMARDPALEDSVREQMIANGLDAIGAVQAASASIAELLASLDSELLAARSTDVRDALASSSRSAARWRATPSAR